MKLLCLPRFGRMGASSRLRTHQYVPAFEDAGIDVHVQPLFSDLRLRDRYGAGRYATQVALSALTERMGRLRRTAQYDLVWIEKEALPWLPASVEDAFLRHVPYCLDFDDATFHRYDDHRSAVVRRVLGDKIDRLMSSARLIVAGNEYLEGRARTAGSSWIEVVPTSLDERRYPIRQSPGPGPVRIVWIGSPATTKYLGLVREPLARLATEHDFVLRVIGGSPPGLDGVRVEELPWSEDTEGQLIAECDIGIMPLADLPWERGKCAYKLIQYMACGLPTVASPVGANRVVVDHGETGFLADTTEEWSQSIRRLIDDAEARHAFGARGRRRVEESYSTRVQGPRLVRFIQEAAGAP